MYLTTLDPISRDFDRIARRAFGSSLAAGAFNHGTFNHGAFNHGGLSYRKPLRRWTPCAATAR